VLLAEPAFANPRLIDATPAEHLGWLLFAQAPQF
jgi:hypothetical protein